MLIVGRGGGSLEDLWAFNEEIVARSIFASRIPVISAVGHEVDFTIADFTADLRAPTPSAAAELVVQHKESLVNTVDVLNTRLQNSMMSLLSRCKQITQQDISRLQNPRKRLNEWQQRIDELLHRLHTTFRYTLDKKRYRVQTIVGKLESSSPLALLSRGYALCRHAVTLQTITSIADVEPGDEVMVRVSKGELRCEVKEKWEVS